MMKAYKLYIIAGEASGDIIGAKLIIALKKVNPNLIIKGIGGPLMKKQGIISLFPIEHISIMGFFEIISKIFKLLKLIKLTVKDIVTFKPNVLITIDSPGFNLKVAKSIKNNRFMSSTSLVHYVSPSVWAYKAKRAHTFAKIFDTLLCLLPFEPKYFENLNIKAHYVGHPITEEIIPSNNKINFIGNTLNMNTDIPSLLLLPGSRKSEIKKMLPVFIQSIYLIQKKIPNFNMIVLTLPSLTKLVNKILNKNRFFDIKIKYKVLTNSNYKYKLFQDINLALAASGTVSLELARVKTPTIVAYKLNLMTTLILYFILKVKFVSIVNILANKMLIPEFLGFNCKASKIAGCSIDIIKNSSTITSDYKQQVSSILGEIGLDQSISPSDKSAKIIINSLINNSQE